MNLTDGLGMVLTLVTFVIYLWFKVENLEMIQDMQAQHNAQNASMI